MMSDLAIKIENVKKQYRLGTIGGGTLQGDLQSWWAKVRGKEDPNSKIGAKVYAKNEKFLALDGINLEVKKGEAIGIIGHNGAGKSTLLKLLSRVTAPTEGNIYINGRISSMLEVGTGFHPELTGRENIYLNGAILGMSREEVTSKIDQIIEFSECGQFIDTPVKRYSSGMYVKLAFSVSAHLDSEILIMDEVLAVGDMKFQQKCIDKMRNVSDEEGRTILYVSHNMSTIRKLCDRCIVLEHGKVVFVGDVEKAIGYYLDNNLGDGMNDFNDYTNKFHMDHLPKDRALYLTSCELLNSCGISISKQEKLKFRLKWELRKPIKECFFRIEFRLQDDTPVCASQMLTPLDVTSGEAEFVCDIRPLVNGIYKALICVYYKNEMGLREDIDAVWPAFAFTKEVIEDMEWYSNNWGYIELPELSVE